MTATPTPFSHHRLPSGLILSTCLLCSKVAASAKPESLKIVERCHYCVANPATLPKRESKGVVVPTAMPLNILSFGHDSALLDNRAAVLASAGYRVSSVTALPDLVSELDVGHPDALVLCHTLMQNETHAALLLMKSAGRDTPVIEISTGHPDPVFDFACRALHPEELLLALASAVLGNQRPAA